MQCFDFNKTVQSPCWQNHDRQFTSSLQNINLLTFLLGFNLKPVEILKTKRGQKVSEIQFASTLLELRERNVLIKIYGWTNFKKILIHIILEFLAKS